MIPYLREISKNDYQQFKMIRYLEINKMDKVDRVNRLEDYVSKLSELNSMPIKSITGHHFCLIFLGEEKNQFRSNEIIGIMSYRHNGKSSKLLEIEIFQKYRKKGYADQLLKSFMNEAKSLGSEYLSLFVFTHSIAAIRLYEKNNFVKWHNFEKGNSMRVELIDILSNDDITL